MLAIIIIIIIIIITTTTIIIIATGKTLLCIKGIQIGNLVSNFRPITWLPLIWKLLTSILDEELHEHVKKQIHYHGNKRDAEKEAEAQKLRQVVNIIGSCMD